MALALPSASSFLFGPSQTSIFGFVDLCLWSTLPKRHCVETVQVEWFCCTMLMHLSGYLNEEVEKQQVSPTPPRPVARKVHHNQVVSGMQQRAGWTQEHAHEERHCPQANGGTEEGLPPERFAFVFLPMLAVFTVKPGEPGEVFKCRLVSCGNKTDETYGDISTNEMDVALMRFLLFFLGS